MDLSIVIPCYNEIETIPKLQQELVPVVARMADQCLAALWPHDETDVHYSRQAHGKIEVIFVDDGSQDGTFLRCWMRLVSRRSPGSRFNLRSTVKIRGWGRLCALGLTWPKGLSL
ncbi:MAG: glycosyltransferase [Caldilineaceae bacterium]